MILKSVAEDLLAEWDSWSQSSPKYAAGDCERKWASFKGGRKTAGLGSLIFMARQDGWRPPWERDGHAKTKSSRAKAPTPKETSNGTLRFTDSGLAELFAKLHGADVRYCYPWGKYLCWDGTRWKIDDQGAVDQLGKKTIMAIHATAAATPDDALRMALGKFATASESAARRAAMLKLAQSEPGIPILPAELDKNPWLLNCINGTLDLKTGELRAHDRADLISKLCPTLYDKAVKCPIWLRFIADITAGDIALQTYLQKAVGCSLTGDVREHVLFFLFGIGANGKSTFINNVQDTLGPDYAMKAPPDLLMVKTNESHPTERFDLFGKRFVACIEAADGKRLAESLVKEMTGGDKIRARRMREDFSEFPPTHKIWLAANHKPVIRGTDVGIWRRIKLIPFTVVIPPERQDKVLPEKLKAEFSGILNWAIQGCQLWQSAGLAEPDVVSAATGQYRQQQDVFARFLDECCIVESTVRARAGDLLAAYRKWSGDDRMSQRRLGEMLTDRGFDTAVIGGYTWRIGIGLIDEEQPK